MKVMKTTKNVFRNVSKVVFVLSVLLMESCSSDDDGGETTADASLILPAALVTSYTGSLVYTPGGSLPIINLEGTATLSIIDGAYTITFSDDVPSISGLIFIEEEDGDFVSVSVGTSVGGISLEDGDLAIGPVSYTHLTLPTILLV